MSCRLVLFVERASLVLLTTAALTFTRIFRLTGIRLLLALHVDDAEVELGNSDATTFNDGSWATDLWILTQPLLGEESVVLFF